MKTLQQWFDEYAVSHQNHTNKKIHYVCVPLIFFSIVGLLMSIPLNFIPYYFDHQALIFNWATVALLFVILFYLRLSKGVAIRMLLFSIVCIIINYLIGQITTLWIVSVLLFVVAWIGQFYGHEIEGKKPSFLKDLQFLLIGPAWVMNHWFKRN
jgi:uncharacterized membrane protein YGL010W